MILYYVLLNIIICWMLQMKLMLIYWVTFLSDHPVCGFILKCSLFKVLSLLPFTTSAFQLHESWGCISCSSSTCWLHIVPRLLTHARLIFRAISVCPIFFSSDNLSISLKERKWIKFAAIYQWRYPTESLSIWSTWRVGRISSISFGLPPWSTDLEERSAVIRCWCSLCERKRLVRYCYKAGYMRLCACVYVFRSRSGPKKKGVSSFPLPGMKSSGRTITSFLDGEKGCWNSPLGEKMDWELDRERRGVSERDEKNVSW